MAPGLLLRRRQPGQWQPGQWQVGMTGMRTVRPERRLVAGSQEQLGVEPLMEGLLEQLGVLEQ